MSWLSKWQAVAALLLSVSLSPALAEIPASERAVLEALYNNTDGDNWTNNSGWNGPAVCPGPVDLGSGVSASPWFGVYCGANDGTYDHVVFVTLGDNNLTGPLPALANLTELRRFFAYSTNSDGSSNVTSLPPDLASLTKLERFSVAGNGPGLTGTIPSLSALTNLAQFRVNHNGLTGSLPSLVGLNNLELFWAQNNGLTGPIPALSGLTALIDFEVDSNQLTGSIPSLSGLTNLQVFTAFTNRLTGALPSLNGLTALRAFSVANNQLTGPIPPLVGQGLSALRRFRVHRNQLTGPVPDITGLSLESFAVGFNQLTGPVPTAPATLLAGDSILCPNNLSQPYPASPAWDAATGSTPWWSACAAAATAGVAAVPTLGEWALILLGLMMAGLAALRRVGRA